MPVVHVLTPLAWEAFQDVPLHALYHELFSWLFPVSCCHHTSPLCGMVLVAGYWLLAVIDRKEESHCLCAVDVLCGFATAGLWRGLFSYKR